MPTGDPREFHFYNQPARADFLEQFAAPVRQDSLAVEVSLLREEIAALRAELAPVPSLILTGKAVTEELRRLRLEAV